MLPQAILNLSPERRATLYSFTYYLGVGAAVAYSSIWFGHQGLSDAQIGIINAVPVFVLLLINLLVGRIADRAKDWRQVIVIGSWLAAAFAAGLFFAANYWPILIIWTLINVSNGSIGPVFDAANSRMTDRRGTSYGAIRSWGTIGFVITVFATGPLVERFGSFYFVFLYFSFFLLRALASLALPQFRSAEESKSKSGSITHLREMLQPWLFLPIITWALLQSTNVAMLSLQAKMFSDQGLSGGVISFLLAISALAEVPVFLAQPWLKRNFTPQTLIMIAAVTTVLRWLCMGFAPGMPWLVPLQMLNAISYGLGWVGMLMFITRWTPDTMAAEALSLLFIVQQIAVIAMVSSFGFLVTHFGAGAFFATSSVAVVATLILLYAIKIVPPPTIAPGQSA